MIAAAKKEELLVFQNQIEKMVNQLSCSYIDAIVKFCEDNDLEIERVPTLLSSHLKSKVEEEASDLKMLKVRVNRLEI
jgi:hypothetical protein